MGSFQDTTLSSRREETSCTYVNKLFDMKILCIFVNELHLKELSLIMERLLRVYEQME